MRAIYYPLRAYYESRQQRATDNDPAFQEPLQRLSWSTEAVNGSNTSGSDFDFDFDALDLEFDGSDSDSDSTNTRAVLGKNYGWGKPRDT
jgi:hypothetical protein